MKIRILALFLVFCVLFTVPALAVPADGGGQYRLLHEIDEYIKSDYLLSDSLYSGAETLLPAGLTAQQLQDDPELFYQVIDQLTSSLDRYSGFFTAEEYALSYPTGKSYVGVGIRLNDRTPYGVFVDELVEGGSAKAEGLLPGDQIVEVDGVDVSGMQYDVAGAYLRGEQDTSAAVKVLRSGETKLLSFTLKRTGLYVPNVTVQVEDDTAVISISQFGIWLDYYDFINIYDELPELGVKNVIIDLRYNPGGYLEVLWGMLDYIVKGEGIKLFSMRTSHGQEESYLTFDTCKWVPEKMIVLVNEYSASASEMFAGTLKDLGLAVVVGNKTYGKARGQAHRTLSSGDTMVLTIETVVLPKTGDYQDKGIMPDYLVENTPIPYKRPEGWIEMGADFALFPGVSSAERVKAMQMRLRELGVYGQEPDGVYDWYTQQCIISAQKAAGLPVTQAYASKAVLGKIDEWMKLLETSEAYAEDDTQLRKALELCG